METNRSPQRGPATALAQLLSEHPDLPQLIWTIAPDGYLSASTFDESNADAVAEALAAVLGGVLTEREYLGATDGRPRRMLHLLAEWHGATFHVTVGEAPVSLPSEWHAAGAA